MTENRFFIRNLGDGFTVTALVLQGGTDKESENDILVRSWGENLTVTALVLQGITD